MSTSRREFLLDSTRLAAGTVLAGSCLAPSVFADDAKKDALFKISLTEYSLHRMMAKKELDNLDFATFTKEVFDIDAVEYWNRPFMDKAKNAKYIGQMKKNAADAGVTGTVILIDGEGDLGAVKEADRLSAVDRHKKWVEAAKELGCHSIRVNARSKGSYEEQLERAADGLRKLSEFAKPLKMNIIVENHGGLSSNGKWLSTVMKTVDMDNCGTLPDFGNFHGYDRYLGTKELMPWAKLVSAKSKAFDKDGNETHTDYMKMMKIVIDADYHDYVGIEFEGRDIPEVEGVRKTKALLERVREKLSA